MNLSLTEEQEMLRTSIRSICEDHFTTQTVRECENNPQAASSLKSMLAEMGVGALLIPERLGGLGLGMADAVVVQSELGRALAPLQFTETNVLGASVFAHTASTVSEEIMSALRSGALDLASAWQDSDDGLDPFGEAAVVLAGEALNGRRAYVGHAPGLTEKLIVPARDESGAPVLCLIDGGGKGVLATSTPNLADAPMAALRFEDAPCIVLCKDEDARRIWAIAFDRMLIALAAQAVGGAERALEIATEYAKTREQFGQPIGSFQAIAHYLADAAVNVEGARFLTFRAAAAADDGDDVSTWAAMAKLKACKTFRDVSALCIQIHGGIGFTLEADPQLFYRRAKHLQLIHGDPMALEERIGRAVTSGQHKALQP